MQVVQDGRVTLLAPDATTYPDLEDVKDKFCFQGAPGFGSWHGSSLTLAVCPGETVDVHSATAWGLAFDIANPAFAMTSPPLIVSASGFVAFGHQLVDKPGETLQLFGVKAGADPLEIVVPAITVATLQHSNWFHQTLHPNP